MYTNSLCYIIDQFLIDYPNPEYPNCTLFYSGTIEYGLNTILNYYLEEVRHLKAVMQNHIKIMNQSNYLNKYNSTLRFTIFESAIGNDDVKNEELYKELDPIYLFNQESHKQSFIVFRHIAIIFLISHFL